MNNSNLLFTSASVCTYDTELGRPTKSAMGVEGFQYPTLWIGATGSVDVIMADGTEVSFAAVPAGTHLPIRVSQVKTASGVAAASIICMY